ncbi:hypothetical protein BBD42_29620 [Paenibacillus sp. BIHB 4019]|uniref:DUF11 domain-containing protein n=1 Tax=Paenibacillus sp. BIHB 4019 TaxID=1870819 RepID=A0A1B2DR74_9BACL|nr:DUF11 domain-containing protein [Paenibacillus sp. BIHB 4019]ANY70201.1 hypothetical protein BBD42_29620 [Paenibacillus sp. BIHB 4019]
MTPGTAKEESLLNQSRILYSAGGTEFVTYSNTVNTPIVGPVITLVKSSESSQAFPGLPVIFAISITNSGNRDADITIYDLLQEGTAFVPNSVHREGIPLPGANPVSGLHLGRLRPHQNIRITFQLMTALQMTSEQLSNRVRADYTFQTTNGRLVEDSVFSNTVTLPVIRIGKPEITITLSVNKTRASPGETLRYTARVANKGDVAADVLLLSTIPSGTLFVRNSITLNGIMQSGEPVDAGIALGSVAPRTQSIVTFEVMVTGSNAVSPGQLLINETRTEGTYRSSDGSVIRLEPSVSNTVSTEVCYPLFQLEVSTNPSIVEPDAVVNYTGLLTNSGNWAADVTLTRLTIRQTVLVRGSILINGVPAADPDASGSINIGNVSPGSTVQIYYQARVSPLVTSPVLQGMATAQYAYELNGVQHSGEVASNSNVIYIEYSYE